MKLKQKKSILGPERIMKVRDSFNLNSTVVGGSTVTVEEIREILGPAYASLLDSQIQGLILIFSMYAKLAISQYIAEKRELIKNKIKVRK